MKRALVLWLLVSVPLFAGTITRTLNFSEQDLMSYKVDGYDVVEIKGSPVMVIPGAPRMPWVLEKLVIPANAVPFSVRIISEEWMDISGDFNVVPAQPDIPLPMPGIPAGICPMHCIIDRPLDTQFWAADLML